MGFHWGYFTPWFSGLMTIYPKNDPDFAPTIHPIPSRPSQSIPSICQPQKTQNKRWKVVWTIHTWVQLISAADVKPVTKAWGLEVLQNTEITKKKWCWMSWLVVFFLHPGRLTWNIQITHLERKLIFQTPMSMFHVNFQGCILFFCIFVGIFCWYFCWYLFKVCVFFF